MDWYIVIKRILICIIIAAGATIGLFVIMHFIDNEVLSETNQLRKDIRFYSQKIDKNEALLKELEKSGEADPEQIGDITSSIASYRRVIASKKIELYDKTPHKKTSKPAVNQPEHKQKKKKIPPPNPNRRIVAHKIVFDNFEVSDEEFKTQPRKVLYLSKDGKQVGKTSLDQYTDQQINNITNEAAARGYWWEIRWNY